MGGLRDDPGGPYREFIREMSEDVTARSAPCRVKMDGATWRLLPYILVLAFLLRATFAVTTNFITHPDEIFQYLEQAHRLVFGYGIVPWEYDYGVRSWIVPGFIALILKSLAVLGLDHPDIYQPAVRLVFCSLSVSLPLSVYRIAQTILDERAARVVLVATAFWPYSSTSRPLRCRTHLRHTRCSGHWYGYSAVRRAVRHSLSARLWG
jgi:hypothetical protein